MKTSVLRRLGCALVCAVAIGVAWPAMTSATGTLGYGAVVSLDCARGPCVAVDDAGSVTVAGDPAHRWVWTARNIEGLVNLSAVACTTSRICLVADSNGRVSTTQDVTAADPNWSTFSDTGLNGIPTDAACAPSGACALVGNGYSNTSQSYEGRIATTGDGTAWQSQTLSSSALSDVACPTDQLCVAVDAVGRVWTSRDPASSMPHWASTQVGSDPFADVSCPSSALCVAVSDHGEVSHTVTPAADDPQWTTHTSVVGNDLAAVACASENLCLIADATGKLYSSTTPAQDAPWAQVLGSQLGRFEALSCTPAPFCVLSMSSSAVVSAAPTDPASWRTRRHIFNVFAGTTRLAATPRVRAGRVQLRLSCVPPGQRVCAGTAWLHDRHTGATWVRRSFEIEVGRTLRLNLSLPTKIRRRLDRVHRLDATLQISALAPSLSVPAPQTQIARRRIQFTS